MRRNAFDEVFCHTVAEVKHELEAHDLMPGDVYATSVKIVDEEKQVLEVLNSHTNDTVLFIEADTRDACVAIAMSADIEIDDE